MAPHGVIIINTGTDLTHVQVTTNEKGCSLLKHSAQNEIMFKFPYITFLVLVTCAEFT